MMTTRHIERMWNAKAYRRLVCELLASRAERSGDLEMQLGQALPAAALALIRLDELNQNGIGLYGRILREMLAAQQADGSWGDPMVTAICLRALLCGRGDGWAVERGLEHLSSLQRVEGIWPAVPIRRMPGDGFVSAYVLLQLGDRPKFRTSIRLADAVAWFVDNEADLDERTQNLWNLAAVRCGKLAMHAQVSAERIFGLDALLVRHAKAAEIDHNPVWVIARCFAMIGRLPQSLE